MKCFRYIAPAALIFSMISLTGCSSNASNNLHGAVDGYGTTGSGYYNYNDNEYGMNGYGTGFGIDGYGTNGYGTGGYAADYGMGNNMQYGTNTNYYDDGVGTAGVTGYENEWNTSAGYWNDGVPGSYGMGVTNDGIVDTTNTTSTTDTTANSTNGMNNLTQAPFLNNGTGTTNF